MNFLSFNGKIFVLGILAVSNFFVWQWVLAKDDSTLRVYFLDVGQGDAVFIETPNGNQILIDGGAGSKILSELGSVLPFYDRSIDVLIETHPDQDHIGGFPDVLRRYRVSTYLEPGVFTDKNFDREIDDILRQKNVSKILARRGQIFDFGDGVVLAILFPDRDMKNAETNEASIIAKIVFGETSFLFTGDSPLKIEDYLMSLDSKILDSDVLKVGHHGSKTSTGKKFVEAVSPKVAVISSGKENRYGHPHKEVLDILGDLNIEVLRTDFSGRVFLKSDGVNIISAK